MARTKICSKCGCEKLTQEFSLDKSKIDDLRSDCKECRKKITSIYRAGHRFQLRGKGSEYYGRNSEYIKATAKERYLLLRLAAIHAYGGECACCGEKRFEFLAIDHIKGGGRKDRARFKNNHYVWYRYLRDNEWPQGEYQILCHNCNASKGYYGACPHISYPEYFKQIPEYY